MKKLLAFVFIVLASRSFATPFVQTILSDPKHPKISATLLYTSKANFDGGVTDVALLYHNGNPSDPWPTTLTDIGMAPPSFAIFEAGVGGNSQSGFVHGGTSLNVAPTLLGPAVNALKNAGGNYAKFGAILVSPNGGGLKLGLGWKTNVLENGGLVRFDQMRFPPRYGVGYAYVF